ncbi:MAG: ATP-binding protein [Cyanobacteria bacterium P01_A01_bin.114]
MPNRADRSADPPKFTDRPHAVEGLSGLLPLFQRLDQRLRQAIAIAEATYGADALNNPYRGLHIQLDEIERLLRGSVGDSILPPLGKALPPLKLSREARISALQQVFDLSEFDLEIVAIALAPDLDLRYERIYAYLQDDVTRKRPTLDLVLTLLCPDAKAKLDGRTHFAPDAPLMRHGLLQLRADAHAPQTAETSQFIQLEPQVVRFLLQQPGLDPQLTACCELLKGEAAWGEQPTSLQRSLSNLVRSEQTLPYLYFQGTAGWGQQAAALGLAAEANTALLTVHLETAYALKLEWSQLLQRIWREARLHQWVLYLDGVDQLPTPAQRPFLKQLSQQRLPFVVMVGRQPLPSLPAMSIDVITVPFQPPDFAQRQRLWQTHLTQAKIELSETELGAISDRFRLTAEQISNAVTTARNARRWQVASAADSDSRSGSSDSLIPQLADLFAAARTQSDQGLSTLAYKITPRYHWPDLILPPDPLAQLQAICHQIKYRPIVYGQWGFDQKLGLGKGLNVLFSGSPGTGKTMAAEVIANELQLDLYKIDLSQIVSKYIGETEKNLDRIFTAAENANSILLFDEADALFGKRSEVKDAHDRYANLEVAYLLQKMEEFEGISVLTSNFRQNLDDAFVRRIRFIIEFPFPEVEYRDRIWQGIWPAQLPLAEDVDLKRLAQHFKLAGGSIRNIALAAAFLAAESPEPVSMAHILQATRREFQKMGRLVNEADFEQLRKPD